MSLPTSPATSVLSQLLGMSFDAAASPSISLAPWRGTSEDAARSGWGFGWYPADDHAAVVIKDPFSTGNTPLSQVLTDWERFRGTSFVCHLRGAAKRVTQQDTHPFCRTYAGRHFLMAHNGDLRGYRAELPLVDAAPEEDAAARAAVWPESWPDAWPDFEPEAKSGEPGERKGQDFEPLFEPIGRTDSEWTFCWLLKELRAARVRRLADLGWPALHAMLGRINALGTANILLCDGQDLVAYRDAGGFGALHVRRRLPPHDLQRLASTSITLELDDPMDRNRSVVLISSSPLSAGFREMVPGEMLVARRGAITWASHPEALAAEPAPPLAVLDANAWVESPQQPDAVPAPVVAASSSAGMSQPQTLAEPAPARPEPSGGPQRDQGRMVRVVHVSTYRYEQAVERSTHMFRLCPVDDPWQDVIEHELTVSPARPGRDFEDVFGNATRHLKFDKPYTELVISSTSLVRVRPTPPLASIDRRTTIPLVWMPWQRQMMNPYLLPPELPETQLLELSEFAMSFVERQDYNLVDTIDDINHTIYTDFSYVSNSTTLSTTPFEVYVNRRGVCQDFANLFICLTRLLGVPARYRVGYIYTGGDYQNKIQSEASHAWAEVYLPGIGWRGFDPTNGCKAGMDHIRVATGRNYRDATPTQGTLYKGGGKETLSVDVRVEVVQD